MIKVRTWIMEQTSREDQRTLYRSESTARISIHKRNALFLIIGRKKEPHIIEEDSIGHLLSLNLRLPPEKFWAEELCWFWVLKKEREERLQGEGFIVKKSTTGYEGCLGSALKRHSTKWWQSVPWINGASFHFIGAILWPSVQDFVTHIQTKVIEISQWESLIDDKQNTVFLILIFHNYFYRANRSFMTSGCNI